MHLFFYLGGWIYIFRLAIYFFYCKFFLQVLCFYALGTECSYTCFRLNSFKQKLHFSPSTLPFNSWVYITCICEVVWDIIIYLVKYISQSHCIPTFFFFSPLPHSFLNIGSFAPFLCVLSLYYTSVFPICYLFTFCN